jgi:hypothetical protein
MIEFLNWWVETELRGCAGMLILGGIFLILTMFAENIGNRSSKK